jgi:hypothetical protein
LYKVTTKPFFYSQVSSGTQAIPYALFESKVFLHKKPFPHSSELLQKSPAKTVETGFLVCFGSIHVSPAAVNFKLSAVNDAPAYNWHSVETSTHT